MYLQKVGTLLIFCLQLLIFDDARHLDLLNWVGEVLLDFDAVNHDLNRVDMLISRVLIEVDSAGNNALVHVNGLKHLAKLVDG